MEHPFHGGSLADAEAAFGPAKDGWLDLSTGINPNAYPDTGISAPSLNRLPDRSELQALLDAARAYYGVPPGSAIVAAPGTQALIQYLPRLRTPGSMQVVSPTYSEHAKAWADGGHAVAEISALPEQVSANVTVVVNPNNPDGRITDPAALLTYASKCQASGGWLIVDEAFADVAPEASLANRRAVGGLVVARSFGKFFGLPGLRLGFLIGDPEITEAIDRLMGVWAVSGPAIEIGTRALLDRPWIDNARAQLAGARRQMEGVLEAAGFSILGGTDLYLLAEHPDAQEKFADLGRAGIYVRRFPERDNWLRFGMPGNAAQVERVVKALRL
ncbi:MAG: threonine-phosphate decarboxylase CobD [Proteobacteria bacterium]|nr:threonine-phosphate decarboxylase CobD [Pseudomonadota bacterium]